MTATAFVSSPGEHLCIGRSAEERPITVRYVGRPDAERRILVVAGQHGDEPAAIAAVQAMEMAWRPALGQAAAFVSCANPDGHWAGTRTNAIGLDLERDHLRLGAPETRALHRYARQLRPELVIEVRTFDAEALARSLAPGLEWGADVMLEIDNHPNALLDYDRRWMTWIEPSMRRLLSAGVRPDRFRVSVPGRRLRSMSPDYVDARNGLSSRLGARGLLLAGRTPSRRFGWFGRTVRSLSQALAALVDGWWALESPLPTSSRLVHLDAVRHGGPTDAFIIGPPDDVPVRRPLPGRTLDGLKPGRAIVLPAAYGVPFDAEALLMLLDRHGFTPMSEAEMSTRLGLEEVASVEGAALTGGARREVAHRRPTVRWTCGPLQRDRRYFATNVRGGDRLAAWLEPGSRFGLHRYPELRLPLEAGRPFPISRGLARAP